MAAFAELIWQIAGIFQRLDDDFVRSQHRSSLAGKGPEVGEVINLVSENLATSNVLRENVHRNSLIKWIENWAQVYRISNISTRIEQFKSECEELRNGKNIVAAQFVMDRLSDVDAVVVSVSSKQTEAGDSLRKIINKETTVDAAIKECKVFNYLVGWVAVDVEGCHRKLQLASDRIIACQKKQSFPVLPLLLFAVAMPGFVISTGLPHLVKHPYVLFAASLGVLIFPVTYYLRFMMGGQDRTQFNLSQIPDPPVIKTILHMLADMRE